MKIKIFASILMTLFCKLGIGQSHTEQIVKEAVFNKVGTANTLIVASINGSIKVEGYDGHKVLIEVTKTIQAKTQARLEQGKEEIQLGVIDRVDTLIYYIINPCHQFRKADHRKNRWSGDENWGYRWDNHHKDGCEYPYEQKMDFIIKVPRSVNLLLSTINEGDVSVKNITGMVRANNVNGSISLINIIKEASASTINGNVDIEYAQNPDKDCRFYSLNGDINAWFQKDLGATVTFESYNGDFFTNILQIEAMPISVQKIDTNDGLKYKLQGNRYKIGKGGAVLDFETFNGNVYLKEKNN